MLPDLLKKNLPVLICGTAVGKRSARVQSYYAGSGNRFWDVLHKIGLTPTLITPEEYRDLLHYGVGLLDLVKGKPGSDLELSQGDFDVERVKLQIQSFRPQVVCFNGKKAAKVFLGKKDIGYGFQQECLGTTRLFVAPSTSAAAKRWWDIKWWQELSDSIKN